MPVCARSSPSAYFAGVALVFSSRATASSSVRKTLCRPAGAMVKVSPAAGVPEMVTR